MVKLGRLVELSLSYKQFSIENIDCSKFFYNRNINMTGFVPDCMVPINKTIPTGILTWFWAIFKFVIVSTLTLDIHCLAL